MENLSGLQESIFNLSRGLQLHFGEKSKNWANFSKFIDFPPFPLFGVPWAAVILTSAAEVGETYTNVYEVCEGLGNLGDPYSIYIGLSVVSTIGDPFKGRMGGNQ